MRVMWLELDIQGRVVYHGWGRRSFSRFRGVRASRERWRDFIEIVDESTAPTTVSRNSADSQKLVPGESPTDYRGPS